MTSAFINKNTPELRAKLEEIGLKETYTELIIGNEDCLKTFPLTGDYCQCTIDAFDASRCIDCTDNEPLFLAIAALNGKTDKGKWFVNNTTGIWLLCTENCITWMLGGGAELYHHIATLEELIEHFKNE